jgi:hypothetical protein
MALHKRSKQNQEIRLKHPRLALLVQNAHGRLNPMWGGCRGRLAKQ